MALDPMTLMLMQQQGGKIDPMMLAMLSGGKVDPAMLMLMNQQGGEIDPMMFALLSGGKIDATTLMLMQQMKKKEGGSEQQAGKDGKPVRPL